KRYKYRRPTTHHSGLTPYLAICPISVLEMPMSRSDRSSRHRSSAIARRQADRSRIFDSSQTAGAMTAVRQLERPPGGCADRTGSGGEMILLALMSGEINGSAGRDDCARASDRLDAVAWSASASLMTAGSPYIARA